jgi:hypothetical protein
MSGHSVGVGAPASERLRLVRNKLLAAAITRQGYPAARLSDSEAMHAVTQLRFRPRERPRLDQGNCAAAARNATPPNAGVRRSARRALSLQRFSMGYQSWWSPRLKIARPVLAAKPLWGRVICGHARATDPRQEVHFSPASFLHPPPPPPTLIPLLRPQSAHYLSFSASSVLTRLPRRSFIVIVRSFNRSQLHNKHPSQAYICAIFPAFNI